MAGASATSNIVNALQLKGFFSLHSVELSALSGIEHATLYLGVWLDGLSTSAVAC